MTLSRVRSRARLFASVLLAALFAAAAAHAQYVYWLDSNWAAPTLSRCNPDGSGRVTLALPANSLPEALALDATNQRLLWTEGAWTGARVRTCNLGLVNVTDLVTALSCARGLALHPGTGQLYVDTSNLTGSGASMWRWNLDGTGGAPFLALGAAANPRGITIDFAGSRLVWADFDQSLILTAPFTGTPVTTLVTLAAGSRPYGLAIDAGAGQLYWTDWANGTISRRALSGGAVTTVLSGLSNPSYLALDPPGSRMFWVEGGAGASRLARATLAGGSVTTLGVSVSAYGGIVYVPSSVYAGVEPDTPAELAFALRSPNPAHGRVSVECALPRESRVRVSVLDVQGRELARLADGAMAAGRHVLAWDAGAEPAGVYFLRFEGGGRTLVRRLTVVH